jgi:prepilin-type N-terminal cleavage/methylation domain-containing protein
MRNSKGFSLIEIITATVLIAIIAVASLEFYRYCYSNFIIQDKLKLEAVNYAMGAMEILYAEEPDSPLLDETTIWVEDGTITEGDLAGRNGHKYRYIKTMSTSGINDEYKLVKTKVTWAR